MKCILLNMVPLYWGCRLNGCSESGCKTTNQPGSDGDVVYLYSRYQLKNLSHGAYLHTSCRNSTHLYQTYIAVEQHTFRLILFLYPIQLKYICWLFVTFFFRWHLLVHILYNFLIISYNVWYVFPDSPLITKCCTVTNSIYCISKM